MPPPPPLILWSKASAARASSDSTVKVSVSAPHPTSPPYADCADVSSHPNFRYVPSLLSICIRRLAPYPDQIRGVALRYAPSQDVSQFDVLKALLPSYESSSESFSLSLVDPRLWATIVQLYGSFLPSSFSTYRIPLSDTHLPLLQHIRSTSTFSLITVLELPGCPELTDDTVLVLKSLHCLVALDASSTRLTSLGIYSLASTCRWSDCSEDTPTRMGPWGLRILRLRDCKAVDNSIFKYMPKFILLSVLDLRGTSVTPSDIPHPFNTWSSTSLDPEYRRVLFHPTPLNDGLSLLHNVSEQLSLCMFPGDAVYCLHIDRLNHVKRSRTYPLRPQGVIDPSDSQEQVKLEDTSFTFTQQSTLKRDTFPRSAASSDSSFSVGISKPSLNREEALMASVFEGESRAHAAKQAILGFYSPFPSREFKPTVHDTGYSAAKQYKQFTRRQKHDQIWQPVFVDTPRRRSGVGRSALATDDTQFMLYRPPPSWTVLDSVPVPTKSASSPSSFNKSASVEQTRDAKGQSRRISDVQPAKINTAHPKMQMMAELSFNAESFGRNVKKRRLEGSFTRNPIKQSGERSAIEMFDQFGVGGSYTDHSDAGETGTGRAYVPTKSDNPFRRHRTEQAQLHNELSRTVSHMPSIGTKPANGIWTRTSASSICNPGFDPLASSPHHVLESGSTIPRTGTCVRRDGSTENSSASPAPHKQKPLKPISRVRVPELPEEEMKRLKESVKQQSRSFTAHSSLARSTKSKGKTDGDIRKLLRMVPSNRRGQKEEGSCVLSRSDERRKTK